MALSSNFTGGIESVKLHTPLLLQSKLLCLSLLYLLTTLPLSIYVSFSQTGCLFTSPSLPITPLYSYPKAYGEHKHALPTARSSCNSSLLFKEYEMALKEVNELCANASSPASPVLKYLEGRGTSFAGNFSTQERKSFFNYREGTHVPCGFFREFPIRKSDLLAMERCSNVAVVSAVFGGHDKIRQPERLGPQTLETVCFFMFVDETTLKGLEKHKIHTHKQGEAEMLGAWRIAKVLSTELPYRNPAMNGVIPKHLIHRLFPNAKFSIWLDAKLQLTVDPLLLIHSLLVSKEADMAISKHPFNVHTMEEAVATARWRKWADVQVLQAQMEAYCENGLQPWTSSKLPYTTDVPDTALILRRHGLGSNLFSCLVFNELEAFNPRDQLPFAYVRDMMRPQVRINMFEVEVFEQVAMEYRHNINKDGMKVMEAHERSKRADGREIGGSSCEGYLLKMWGESSEDN